MLINHGPKLRSNIAPTRSFMAKLQRTNDRLQQSHDVYIYL